MKDLNPAAVDLQLATPSGYTQSQAFAFDANDDIVGKAYVNNAWHGAMWVRQ